MWVSYTLDDESPDAPILRSGESLEAAMATAREHGATAVLFNCSQPEIITSALPNAVELANGLAVGVYSNAFEPKPKEYAANEVLLGHREDLGPAGYLNFVEQWVATGATIVGGCCGIMPPHIATIRGFLDQ